MNKEARIFFIIENLYIRDYILYRYSSDRNDVFVNRLFRDKDSVKRANAFIMQNLKREDYKKIVSKLEDATNDSFFPTNSFKALEISTSSRSCKLDLLNPNALNVYWEYAILRYKDISVIKLINNWLIEHGYVMEKEVSF